MSFHIHPEIACDSDSAGSCVGSYYGLPKQSAADVRAEAKNQGWAVNVRGEGRPRDFCPRCKAIETEGA